MEKQPGKQYGLIKPKELKKPSTSASATFFQKKNIFDDDSDDDDGGSGGPTDYKKAAVQAKMKRQTKLDLERAKEEDASVFQYDEVYDEMQEKKRSAAIAAKKSVDRKPKYIANLMKHAEIRAREDERRTERKVQKEREAEGDEFRDKEVFVTSAYRKKMEEMQKEEEEEQRKERIEAMLDVTKQRDMSGFYRHIYRQTMGEEKGQKEEDVKKEPRSDDEDNKDEVRTEIKKLEKKERNFRKRDVKQEEEESEDESSSDSGSSSEDEEKETVNEEVVMSREEKEAERRQKMREDKERRERRKRRIERGEESSSDEEEEGKEKAKVEKKSGKDAKVSGSGAAAADKPLPRKVKKDVWKKVTVDDVFAEAVAKYFRRKAERSGFPWEA